MAAVGTLTIEMAANVARLQRDMERATKTVGGAMDRIQRSVQGATRALGLLTAAFAAYKTVQGIIQQADAMTLLNSRLQLVTKSQEEFIKTQAALVSISQRSYTNLGATVDLYTALSRATANLGVSQNELLRVVETFNKSIIISGGSTQAAEAAITQFNQAMASGVLRGEEFNSISEQAPMIMEILANQLGVTRGALRDMAKEGLLVAELVLPALLEGSKSVDEQFQRLNKTVGQSGVQFKNQFALLLDELNKLTGGTSGASSALDGLTFNLEVLTNLLRAINGPAQAFNETQAETERLLRQNEAAAKANNEAVKSRAKAMLEEKERMEQAKKAADELQKSYEKLLDSLRGDLRGSTAALQSEQQGLNKAQEEFLELVSGPEWKQYSAAQKMIIADLFKQRIETEQLIDLEKKRAKAAEDRLKKMLADEKEFREELRKEDEKLAAEKLKKEQEFYEAQRREIEKIGDQLTDALMRAFESGKGFGQAFKDTLVNMFRTMVLRPVLAPIVGSFLGGASGSAAAQGVDVLSMVSGVSTMYNIVTTGFAKVGATVSESLLRAGDYLATSSIDAVAAGGEFLQSISQAAGPIASSIAGAATGMFINNLISGGYSMGKGMDTFQKIGIAVASFVGGPVLGTIVGAATGVFNRLFGRKLSDVGIQGTFGDSGFSGQAYKFYKGGLFRSNQTKRSPLDVELESFLSDSFLAIQGATAAMAVALNQSADSIFTFTKDIKLSFKGLNEEQIQALLTETFETLGDDLAALALGTDEFSRRGESASETLQRLYQSLTSVNSVFDTLGLTMYEFTLAGADMASQLVDLLGGMETFVEATTAYYQEFYSEAERVDILTRQLTTSFGQLGLGLPATREAFRALVEAQDLTTESGRQLFAALMKLSPAFASISPSIDLITESIDDLGEVILSSDSAIRERISLEDRLYRLQGNTVALRNREREAVDGSNLALLDQIFLLEDQQDAQIELARQQQEAYDNARASTDQALQSLRRAIDAQKRSINLTRELAQQQASEIKSVFDVLNNAILGLTGGGFTATSGIAFIQQALSSAQRTGYLPDANELSRAITAATAGSDATTSFERRKEQALLVARLTQLREFADDQLTTAEEQLLALDKQLEALDAQLTQAENQINVLRGIDTGIKSIPESIRALQTALSSELKALGALQKQQQTIVRPSGGGAFVGPPISLDPGPQSITISVPRGSGPGLSINASAISGFAAGGMHSGGLRLVGERGPELEMTGPAKYMSNATLASMVNNGSNEEIKQMREENKVQMRTMVSLQNRMTKIIEQWNGDGLPTERVEA